MATHGRRSRFTLLGLMLSVAISALVMTVVVQSIRLRDASIFESQLRAELTKQRAEAELMLAKAEAARLFTQSAELRARVEAFLLEKAEMDKQGARHRALLQEDLAEGGEELEE